jgi:23S rRNA (cytosine1962-C5)-methyltransferase
VITTADIQIDATFLKSAIIKASKKRTELMKITDAYRVVNSEGDSLPSIVIDRYNDIFAFQLTSAGAETLKTDLISIVREEFSPKTIIEKNAVSSRKRENLPETEKIVFGKDTSTIVREGDLRFEVNVLYGQKTGAYLDYRPFRFEAEKLAHGRCLDLFAYQGWLSCHIAKNAKMVTAIDSSQEALAAARKNAVLNSISNIEFSRADAFDYLKTCCGLFDFIHIDPPAVAKNRSDVGPAIGALKKITLSGIKRLNPGGTLLISSCSHKITERILEGVVIDTGRAAKRTGRVVFRGIQDLDHKPRKGLAQSLYLKGIAANFE